MRDFHTRRSARSMIARRVYASLVLVAFIGAACGRDKKVRDESPPIATGLDAAYSDLDDATALTVIAAEYIPTEDEERQLAVASALLVKALATGTLPEAYFKTRSDEHLRALLAKYPSLASIGREGEAARARPDALSRDRAATATTPSTPIPVPGPTPDPAPPSGPSACNTTCAWEIRGAVDAVQKAAFKALVSELAALIAQGAGLAEAAEQAADKVSGAALEAALFNGIPRAEIQAWLTVIGGTAAGAGAIAALGTSPAAAAALTAAAIIATGVTAAEIGIATYDSANAVRECLAWKASKCPQPEPSPSPGPTPTPSSCGLINCSQRENVGAPSCDHYRNGILRPSITGSCVDGRCVWEPDAFTACPNGTRCADGVWPVGATCRDKCSPEFVNCSQRENVGAPSCDHYRNGILRPSITGSCVDGRCVWEPDAFTACPNGTRCADGVWPVGASCR